MLSCFSHVRLFATQWTVACQAPLSMGFSRQEYWSGLPCPSPSSRPRDQTRVSYISYTGKWVLYHHRQLGSQYSIFSYYKISAIFPVWYNISLYIILYLIVCMSYSPSPILLLPPFLSPLVTTSLLSISVSASFLLLLYSLVCCIF